jgi:hypothetical protein
MNQDDIHQTTSSSEGAGGSSAPVQKLPDTKSIGGSDAECCDGECCDGE